ncbi:MAG: MarR family transcriptional regulator, partial [Cyclobacteriaceae bacterium]|nr:MarR family transcriptional regulator [Cyclobacteriaceae bacterium]
RVTPEQFTLLAALHYEEGCTQGKLAGLVNRDKTTISRVIDNMVKNGLVKRKVQSKDRRGRIITLTDKGRQIKDDLIEKTGRVYLETLTGVKPADFQATYAVLGQMMDNLERMK